MKQIKAECKYDHGTKAKAKADTQWAVNGVWISPYLFLIAWLIKHND